MPEVPAPAKAKARRRFPVLAGAALASGAALAAIAGLGGAASVLGATLAQPAFALAVSGWRRGPSARAALKRDAISLSVLWLGTAALFAAVLAWPFSVLLATGSLGATLASSLALGLALLAAWRLWPLWHGIERDGGGVDSHWRALARFESGAWRGLAAAGIVVALAALPLLLAWPELLDPRGRWILALSSIAAAPLLHALLQGLPAPEALPERWIEEAHDGVDADAEDASLSDPGQSPEAALYAAARTGRVDRALALLEAGADPHAGPPGDERDQRSLPVLAAVLPDLRLLRALIALNFASASVQPPLRSGWHSIASRR